MGSKNKKIMIGAFLGALLFCGVASFSSKAAGVGPGGTGSAGPGTGPGSASSAGFAASSMGGTFGIDVSYYQGNIDWNAVKNSGVQFAFVRLGHGEHVLDSKFSQNMLQATMAGIPVGVYFYSTARSVGEAISDAQFVIDNLSGYLVTYPVAIDLEDQKAQGNLSKSQVTAIAKAFCDQVRGAGYSPAVYCNEDWYRSKIDASQLPGVDMWIARWASTYDTSIPRSFWQYSSEGRVDGIEGNVDLDIAFQNYGGGVSSTPGAGNTSGQPVGWIRDDVGWWYRFADGGYPTNTWLNIEGKRYWFDAEGYMATGWELIDGKWHYFNEDGLAQTGWLLLDGTWYYLNPSDGTMAEGWLQLGGTWYYLNPGSGAMAADAYVGENGEYYVDASGAWVQDAGQAENGGQGQAGGSSVGAFGESAWAGEWILSGDLWWYRHADGGYTTNGWELINGNWYYFDASGWMAEGWQQIGGTWYYLNPGSGAMATGWQQIGGTWYYLYENGAMASDAWIDNYYVDASGAWTQTR